MATTASANPSFVPQSPSHWVPDAKRNSCKSCHHEFTFFFRRHHCRSCREVFCDDCSDFRLLTRDPKDPSVVISVRACRPCFDKFRGRKMRGAKAKSGHAAAPHTAHHVRRNSKATDADKSHTQAQNVHTKREVEMETQPSDDGAVKGSEDILHIPADALASVKGSGHAAPHVDVDPQQHAHYEGEDAAITGTETIRVEEDDDHVVYPDNAPHPEQGHTIKLWTVLSADGQAIEVPRDQVMAAQGSVVLPSSSAEGGLQFVNVDHSHAATRPSATIYQHSSTTTTTSTTSAASATSLPSDTAAVFNKSELTARTPNNAASTTSGSNIVFHPVDKDQLIVSPVAGSEREKDEFERATVGAVEGSEDILHIPADALASVKNSALLAKQQQHQSADGEVAWSDRNVENRFAAASPTAAVPMLFDEAASSDKQQQQQQRGVDMVV